MYMNIQNLNRMQNQFNREFNELFRDSEIALNRSLKQKLIATQNIDDYNNRTVLTANQFYK